MKKGQKPSAKAILILTFCLLSCPVLNGMAADEIKLRKYPSKNGPVLDTVPRKMDFKFVESFGPWRYTVVDGSTYGGGWINTEDLKEESVKKPLPKDPVQAGKARKNNQRARTSKKNGALKNIGTQNTGGKKAKHHVKTVSKSKPHAGSVRIKPIAIQLAESPVGQKETPARIPKPAKISKAQSKVKDGRNPSKALKATEPALAEAVHSPTPSKAVINVSPPDGTSGNVEQRSEHGNQEDPRFKTVHADPPEKAGLSHEKQERGWKKSVMSSAIAEAAENTVNPTHLEQSREAPTGKVAAFSHQISLKEILNMGLRLLTVIMACFAIVFSYKAKKIADMSYALTLQLQQHMKITRGREFDERY